MYRTRRRSQAPRPSRLVPGDATRRAAGAQRRRAGDWSSVRPASVQCGPRPAARALTALSPDVARFVAPAETSQQGARFHHARPQRIPRIASPCRADAEWDHRNAQLLTRGANLYRTVRFGAAAGLRSEPLRAGAECGRLGGGLRGPKVPPTDRGRPSRGRTFTRSARASRHTPRARALRHRSAHALSPTVHSRACTAAG
jgi:hypothetical protein